MTTTHDTQATEEGPNQSTITEAVPLPTNSGRMGLRDLLDRFFAAIRSNTNADLDGPEDRDENATLPLGVKLTGYRLLNIAVMFTIGVAKFILSLKGQSIAPTGLEYAGGSVLAIWLYWIGFYEAVEPRRWGWFFHEDWAPAIGFASKYLLGAVLWWLVLTWKFLPLFVVILPCIIHLGLLPGTSAGDILSGSLSGFLSSLSCLILPEKWLVWHHIPVWAPFRQFYRKYGSESGSSIRDPYRLVGNVGFCLGLLLGPVLLFWSSYLFGLVFGLVEASL